MAAGRLIPVKRYDLLIRAFAEVVAVHPDWQLRTFGGGDTTGDEKERLSALIGALRLGDNVRLMGNTRALEAEWAKGSIAASASDRESFGMTIVEAKRCSLPVVSTDCPVGPREIIADRVDGRLVRPGDAGAVAAASLELIGDAELRRRMAAEGHEIANTPGPTRPHRADPRRDTRRGRTRTTRHRESHRPRPTLVRPPGGATNDDVSTVMEDLGLAQILWSVTAKGLPDHRHRPHREARPRPDPPRRHRPAPRALRRHDPRGRPRHHRAPGPRIHLRHRLAVPHPPREPGTVYRP